jgi:hypothetical protein
MERLDRLVDAWCERRCFRALRRILAGWPIGQRLNDEWALLLTALKNVRAFAGEELTDKERLAVDELVSEVEHALHRSRSGLMRPPRQT